MKENKLDTITNLFDGKKIRSVWDSEKEDYYLRDNMTDIEIALTSIGKIATRDIATSEHPQGLSENVSVAKRGGKPANAARVSYEQETKKSAIFIDNSLNYKYIDDNKKIQLK